MPLYFKTMAEEWRTRVAVCDGASSLKQWLWHLTGTCCISRQLSKQGPERERERERERVEKSAKLLYLSAKWKSAHPNTKLHYAPLLGHYTQLKPNQTECTNMVHYVIVLPVC